MMISNAGLGPTWGKYGYGRQAPGNGAMGLYDLSNVYVSGGNLTLRTQLSSGAWTSAGVSSGNGFSAYQRQWQVRARFDQAKGIGYAFLLYPNDKTWPPEIDIAEGKVNGPSIMSTLHWAPNNQQVQKWNTVPDMTAWHTYGVIIEPTTITYTLDGVPWTSFATANAPIKNMWIGLQTGAMSCPSAYEACPAGFPMPPLPPAPPSRSTGSPTTNTADQPVTRALEAGHAAAPWFISKVWNNGNDASGGSVAKG